MDQRTWKTISSIKLWKAAKKPGRPVMVSQAKLRKILRYYLGDKVNSLVLPNQLTVQTGGRVFTHDELKSRVVAFLTPRAKGLGGDVELKNLQLPSDMFFKNSADKLVIGLKGDLKPGRNQFSLRGVSLNGKIISRKGGTVFLDVWKAVPVAAKPLRRFERLTKDKVSFQRVNLAYKPDLWDGTGGPWRMSRTLGRNQPFTKSHLEQIPLIEKGERVKLIYKGKKVQLTIKVEALGEASMGQQVTVRNLQSKRTILATVVGDDLVMVR
jgi:flagella basal body P-ring formation protein FlgA